MKIRFSFVLVGAISVGTAGCGASPTVNRAGNTIQNQPVVAGNTVPPTSVAPPAGQAPIPGITGPANQSNIDVNTPPAGNVGPQKRQIVDVPAIGPPMKPMAVEASEDSSIVTIMDRSGVATETRTFRSDQNIAKLVKQTYATGSKVTIILKNGRKISLDGSQIPQINAVSLTTIRELAGIKPPAPKTDTGSKGTAATDRKPQ